MNFSKKSGKKKGAAAAVICFVAAIAIAGTYTFNDYKQSQYEEELAKAEEMDFTEEEQEAVDGEIVANEVESELDTQDTNENSSNEELPSEMETEEEQEELPLAEETAETVENVSSYSAATVNFTDESMMLWPVSGTILLDYSMDQTVYFKTLDQYKYNPAMIIAGAEGDQVIAGAAGLVKSIDEVAETGTTVNVDLGNGYEAFYGQLVNVQVYTGDYVEATSLLGYVSQPTKYYSSEGSNVYFEMRKDGQPIDPKEFLVDSAEE